jgi:CRISPR-associated protein Csx3
MASFNISISGDTMTIGFGAPAQNGTIVMDAEARLKELADKGELTGGPLLKITGPASLPVAFVLAHAVCHLFETVAVFDPKLDKFVVSTSHGTAHKVGDLIDKQ